MAEVAVGPWQGVLAVGALWLVLEATVGRPAAGVAQWCAMMMMTQHHGSHAPLPHAYPMGMYAFPAEAVGDELLCFGSVAVTWQSGLHSGQCETQVTT